MKSALFKFSNLKLRFRSWNRSSVEVTIATAAPSEFILWGKKSLLKPNYIGLLDLAGLSWPRWSPSLVELVFSWF